MGFFEKMFGFFRKRMGGANCCAFFCGVQLDCWEILIIFGEMLKSFGIKFQRCSYKL